MNARILLAMTALVAWPIPTNAQWSIESQLGKPKVTATGVDGLIHVELSCRDDDEVSLTVALMESGGLRSGHVGVEWDDQAPKLYALQNKDGTLSGSSGSPHVNELIAKLRERETVLLRAVMEQGDSVADRISLAGSFRAIGSLPCSSTLRASRPQLTDARIREILVSRSVANYSGSCPCPYSTDRAGRRCGRRSAYSRPGGASPLCYPRDVTDAAVEAYRKRLGGGSGFSGATASWTLDGSRR